MAKSRMFEKGSLIQLVDGGTAVVVGIKMYKVYRPGVAQFVWDPSIELSLVDGSTTFVSPSEIDLVVA